MYHFCIPCHIFFNTTNMSSIYIYMYIYWFTSTHAFSLLLSSHNSQHKTSCQRMWIFSIIQNKNKLDLMIQLSMVIIFCSKNQKSTSQPHLMPYLHSQVSLSTAPMLHAHWYYLEYQNYIFPPFLTFIT